MMSSKKDQFSDRIFHVRRNVGYSSQKKFADYCGVSERTVNLWENDKSKPSVDVLIRLAINHSLNINWLLTGEGPMFLGEQDGGINDNRPPDESERAENERLREENRELNAELRETNRILRRLVEERGVLADEVDKATGRIANLQATVETLSAQADAATPGRKTGDE